MKTPISKKAYDKIADAYAAITDKKPHNAYYDRPAVKSLIGDVAGRKIADVGCGTGAYAQWLADRGARVTAIDANEKMLAHARKRVGGRASFHLANMEEPFPFLKDGSLDGVLSALAITYVRDHKALFSEFHRILRKKGWLVFSTEHPFFSYGFFKIRNYFKTRRVSCSWKGFGKRVRMNSYYHSLGSICEALYENGFLIERIVEPKPIRKFKEVSPKDYRELMNFPLFICMKAWKT
ncbi:MAG: methyltransferase domain-containing protein [Anaerolineales bacterium]|nr:methyltransferase domain-containing protein [Anaerolineales bacterium]